MSIKTADGKVAEGLEQDPFEPIAIIGLGALMPDAQDVDQFWQNIKQGKVSIKNIQADRWPGKLEDFWKSGGPGDIEEGYTYSKIGAFVDNFEFNWRRWRQPPGTLGQIDPVSCGQLKFQLLLWHRLVMMVSRVILTAPSAV